MQLRSKPLCLLAAVFALGAIGGSTASAAEFHTASSPTSLTGAQISSFRVATTSGEITCKTQTFSGTATTNTSSSITLVPDLSNCLAFGFVNLPVHENGCSLVFHANGTTEIECPVVGGVQKELELTIPGCTSTLGPQHLNAGGNTFTNNAGKTDIVIDVNVQDIEYKECNSGLLTGGSYKGTLTLTGSSSIWYE